MILNKNLLLFFIGVSSGSIIAAGIFAFITVLGLIPRIADRTHTAGRIHLYETLIVLGGTAGNIVDLYEVPMAGGVLVCLLYSVSSGIFVGCLVMSIAETLNAFPVFVRRIRMSVGIQYAILAMALGKMFGSLYYFIKGIQV